MASIAPVSSVSNPLLESTAPTRVPKQILGQEDFLKLLTVQFRSQDPMKPMEDTAFIAQMAQFSSLEQSQSMTQQLTKMRASQDLLNANGYIGREVTVDLGKAGVVKGNVEAVEVADGVPSLVINKVSYPLSSVLHVAPGAAATPTAPATLP